MNLPNKLTVIRVIMVPIFLVFLTVGPLIDLLGDTAARIIAAAIFAIASFTDMLDGKIARKYGLVTDFGKFMDPLADKLLVFGALLGIVCYSHLQGMSSLFVTLFTWTAFIVMFRELAVTSMRLVIAGKSGKVIAAQWSGKVKTVTQMLGIIICMVEPIWSGYYGAPYLSYIAMAAITFMTLYSGIEYMIAYFPLMDPNK
ncbi:MAG: CDP-diacylglycerol--glycerol-3-phosphate 3-phosphatidyltransferase [Clostridia bacterium]|nr:CDP-diacylglycerol--glycerol-3-phosphate 3-phosphatidyltransferase [Clostridia bacterium]